jgi:hypothetical protein
MIVSYEPNWSDGEFACGHFEFRSPYDPPRRIPVSETGYRSHFVSMAEIAQYAKPEDYVIEFVRATLQDQSKSGDRHSSPEQLTLF